MSAREKISAWTKVLIDDGNGIGLGDSIPSTTTMAFSVLAAAKYGLDYRISKSRSSNNAM
jgi:NaMN:DMB phosphoribosyltransferase